MEVRSRLSELYEKAMHSDEQGNTSVTFEMSLNDFLDEMDLFEHLDAVQVIVDEDDPWKIWLKFDRADRCKPSSEAI